MIIGVPKEVKNNEFRVAITASGVNRPPSRQQDGLAPDEGQLKLLGDAMAKATGWVSQYSWQLYDTSGTTEDWNYAAAGTPLRKQFIKSPLKFSRVTSGFSKRRFHPVLKYFRPHYGIDYGAPVGTPVMTTADGVIVEARYKAGEGNFIRVRHSSSVDTCYLHLSRFAKGLKKGTRVAQGDQAP